MDEQEYRKKMRGLSKPLIVLIAAAIVLSLWACVIIFGIVTRDGERSVTAATNGSTQPSTTESIPQEEYHICDADGTCTLCGLTFDTEKMVLGSIAVEKIEGIDRCGIFVSEESSIEICRPISIKDISMPIVELKGDLSKVTKEEEMQMAFSYEDEDQAFDCFAQVKLQGSTSLAYDKKNYSIKLLKDDGKKNKVELVDGWGEQHRYCLKANYVDPTHARNLVSAQLYADVISARNVEDELSDLVNGGAVDGYPVLVYNDGAFLGLYTMNIPKDKWLLGMDDSEEKDQAILVAADWSEATALRTTMSIGADGWELEFYSNEESQIDNDPSWVAESFNDMITFVIENDGQDFIDGISQYVDVDKCIDSMIHTVVIYGRDNLSKNVLWATFDGTVWFSSVYDMDGTWGAKWDGTVFYLPEWLMFDELATFEPVNLLWSKLYQNFYDRIAERYAQLRQGPLSMENITARFETFSGKIPDVVWTAEQERWPDIPHREESTLEQILDFAAQRLGYIDAQMLS